MTATDLFPSTSADSPRLAWLKRHDLIVREYQHPHSLNDSHRFICANRAMTRWQTGDTEDEAEQAYCERYGVAWWKLAAWNEAMADEPEKCIVCGGDEPCSHDFNKESRQLEQIGRAMGTALVSTEDEMQLA